MTEALRAILIIPLALKIIFYFQDARSADQEEALQPLLAVDQDEEAHGQEGIESATDEEVANEEEVSEHANEESNEQASEIIETRPEVATAEKEHPLC